MFWIDFIWTAVRIFVLRSVGLVRKYGVFLLDIILSYYECRYMYVIDLLQRARVIVSDIWR